MYFAVRGAQEKIASSVTSILSSGPRCHSTPKDAPFDPLAPPMTGDASDCNQMGRFLYGFTVKPAS